MWVGARGVEECEVSLEPRTLKKELIVGKQRKPREADTGERPERYSTNRLWQVSLRYAGEKGEQFFHALSRAHAPHIGDVDYELAGDALQRKKVSEGESPTQARRKMLGI